MIDDNAGDLWWTLRLVYSFRYRKVDEVLCGETPRRQSLAGYKRRRTETRPARTEPPCPLREPTSLDCRHMAMPSTPDGSGRQSRQVAEGAKKKEALSSGPVYVADPVLDETLQPPQPQAYDHLHQVSDCSDTVRHCPITSLCYSPVQPWKARCRLDFQHVAFPSDKRRHLAGTTCYGSPVYMFSPPCPCVQSAASKVADGTETCSRPLTAQ